MATKQPQYSGDSSEEFWKRINGLKNEKISMQLYKLGCRLQELEGTVLDLLQVAESIEEVQRSLK